MSEGAARGFAEALGATDWDAVGELVTDDVDFRAMTPNSFWEAVGPRAVIDDVLHDWFDDVTVTGVSDVTEGEVGPRRRIAYRIGVDRDGVPHVAEQQAYYELTGGRISWIRIICAGILPVADD